MINNKQSNVNQKGLEVITYENNPEWNRLEVNNKYDQWTISSCSNGDIEIECFNSTDGGKYLFLNQEELKQVIEFLQSRIIKQ